MKPTGRMFPTLSRLTALLICLALTPILESKVHAQPRHVGLFGIVRTDGLRLVNIDPETGDATPVGEPTGFRFATQGVSALDVADHRYFAQMEERLVSIDTRTGDVITSPTFPLVTGSLQFQPRR